MSKEQELSKLTKYFEQLGAHDPRGWASSQVNEGTNQFARFIFLRQAWSYVVTNDDPSWMDQEIQQARTDRDAPGAGSGPALDRLLELGASRNGISEVVRVMQWQRGNCCSA